MDYLLWSIQREGEALSALVYLMMVAQASMYSFDLVSGHTDSLDEAKWSSLYTFIKLAKISINTKQCNKKWAWGWKK